MIFCFLIDFLKFCLLSLKLDSQSSCSWLFCTGQFFVYLESSMGFTSEPGCQQDASPPPERNWFSLMTASQPTCPLLHLWNLGHLTGCSLKVASSIWSTVLLSLTILWCALSTLRSIRYISMPTLGANIQLLLDSASSQYLTSNFTACVHAHSVAQSCLTLWDPMDCSLPGSIVRGIILARILEWVVISFSRDFPDPGIKPMSPAAPALVLVNIL